jgi:putative transposase
MDLLPLAAVVSGLVLDQLRRLKQLEHENARLKKLLAEQALAHEALKEVLEKRGFGERAARSWR